MHVKQIFSGSLVELNIMIRMRENYYCSDIFIHCNKLQEKKSKIDEGKIMCYCHKHIVITQPNTRNS